MMTPKLDPRPPRHVNDNADLWHRQKAGRIGRKKSGWNGLPFCATNRARETFERNKRT
jgi:hypothetical protein